MGGLLCGIPQLNMCGKTLLISGVSFGDGLWHMLRHAPETSLFLNVATDGFAMLHLLSRLAKCRPLLVHDDEHGLTFESHLRGEDVTQVCSISYPHQRSNLFFQCQSFGSSTFFNAKEQRNK